ncbi:MAG TPA: hypothetical protein VLX58_18010, partial [Bryobacteraceae bacterium]|nr:hypothetical protein [Bryobacteraceae bacterium]
TPGLNYTATSSAPGWLWLTTAAGSLPASVGVLVQPTGLAPGVYKGGINISVPGTANASQLITVTLTITSAPALSASAGPLIFAYNIGDPQPVSQTIAVSSTGSPLNFSASTSGGNWLSVSPARGATPGSIAVSVNPAGLAAGTYNGLVSISSQAAVNGLQVVAVTLNVSTHAPSITSVSDAASYLSTAFAPGSIISVWGTLLGPTTPVSFQVSSTGTISNVLADTQVFFDGFPATLLMVSDKQINAIVPYEVTGKTTSTMQVQYQGVKSSTWQVNIVPASPSLFTADQSGKGQGAILNQDGSVNSDSNPADQGSIVVLWGTGDGQTDPPGVDGVLAPDVLADLARPLLGVTVQIDNLDADVIYDGAAPGLVAGVLQINVRLPDGVHSGDVPVVVYVGGYPSQPGVTLAIK